MKLHGSINWFYSGASETSSEQIYFKHKDDDFSDENLHSDLIPFIVPPVFDKASLYRHSSFNRLWSNAAHYMNNAEEIVIIGYSLPITDLSTRLFFKDNCSNLKRVIVVNPSAKNKAFKESHETIFSDCEIDYIENLNEFIQKHCGPQNK